MDNSKSLILHFNFYKKSQTDFIIKTRGSNLINYGCPLDEKYCKNDFCN